ncbi:MAG: hypothetical protein Q8P67_03410, partial [archaeon]|nr:hypothetical protein [archaeon]
MPWKRRFPRFVYELTQKQRIHCDIFLFSWEKKKKEREEREKKSIKQTKDFKKKEEEKEKE